MGCVYEVINTVTGAHYVGVTTRTLAKRRRQHLERARSGTRTHFANALRKYGAEVFEWVTLKESDTKAELLEFEIAVIALRKSQGVELYNITHGGEGSTGFTDEMRERIRQKLLGRPSPNKGKPLSEETKLKISQAKLGKPSWNKGKCWSDEARQKMSEGSKGKLHTAETRALMSRQRTGKKRGPYKRAGALTVEGTE